MAKNLKYQFKNAIESAFVEGQDKHSLKKTEGLGNGRVFSYSDRRNLIDLSANFSNYMRENYSDIKRVADVKTEHIQSFLNSKSETCTTKTLDQYKSKFAKLEQLVNKRYNVNTDYHSNLIRISGSEQTGLLRQSAMSKNDYQKLSSRLKESDCASSLAIQISARTGMRVDGLTNLQKRDIDIEKGTIHIIEKGAKERTNNLKQEDISFFKNIVDKLQNDNDRVIPVKENSINQYLKRKLEKINDLEIDYAKEKTGIHCIRKMAAQDHYDELRNEGLSMHDAWSETSVWLGHGADRDELFAVYVKNRW